MINFELLLAVLIRGILGIFLAVVIGGIFWVISWLYFQEAAIGTGGFLVAQAFVVGAFAGLGTMAAWWNMESPRSVQLLYIVFTLGTTIMTAWLAIEVLGVDTYVALVGGTYRIPVMSLGDMLSKMIFAAVLGGNSVGAAFYLYRALRYHEL